MIYKLILPIDLFFKLTFSILRNKLFYILVYSVDKISFSTSILVIYNFFS
jgi:hypothetical protein